MNQQLSDSEAEHAVYQAMLALQASVNTSGLEKDLMDLVCLRTSHRKRTNVHRENSLSSIVARFRTTRIAWLYKFRRGEHQCTHA
jgi:hypothetical protein